jgi:DNA replication protein DnaC
MIKQTESLLEILKMKGVQATLSQRLKEADEQELGYEDFLNVVFEDEKLYRENDRVARLIKRAALQQKASLESFETMPSRGVDRKMLNDLALMRFVQNGQNIILSGPTGVGKSYLACAIGNNVCRNGFTTQFFRMNTLIEKFSLERAKGTYLNFIKRLTSASVLILDDFGIKPLSPHQYQDLYDVIDERGSERSLIITTQLPLQNWNEVIDDPVTCEAITDRVTANSIKITMSGPSFRQKKKVHIDKV